MADTILKEAEQKMKNSLAVLKKDFDSIRTGRASVSLLDTVQVSYYGTPTALSHIGTLSTPDPQTITITPWEKPLIPDIEKAIMNAGLGLNPSNDGDMIRINIPPLTEERRKELSKLAKKYTEDAKISIRNVRRDANEKFKNLEKNGDISEDDCKRNQDSVQKITDKTIQNAETLYKRKDTEIME